MIDPIDLFFSVVILTYFGTLVCFNTVLWVIIVEVSLSDCLLGIQLHSRLIHYFMNSLISFHYNLHCRIGIDIALLANSLI